MTAAKIGYHEFTEIASEYKWTLYNFSSFSEANGDYFCSPIFKSRVPDHNDCIEWELRLYPDGVDKISKGYVSIYLDCLNVCNRSVDCEFTLSSSVKICGTGKFSNTFLKPLGFGYQKFINRTTLLADLEIGDGTLTITVKVNFSDKLNKTYPKLNLTRNFGSLLEMGEHSDVILITNDGIEHKAHKAILVCRSKVFSAMFQHNMKESQDNVVNIEDMDDETLKVMLQFMYTGEVLNMRDKAKKLLVAADKYELDDLKDLCIYHICESMTIHNILEFFELACTYNINELKLKSKEYFLKNRKAIMRSAEEREHLKNLPRDVIEELVCDLALLQ